MTANIKPMPQHIRDHLREFPDSIFINQPPPIFESEPTPADRKLALKLWRALDLQSRRWYARWNFYKHKPDHVFQFAGLALTPKDVAALREDHS